jgi:hypothetical protein
METDVTQALFVGARQEPARGQHSVKGVVGPGEHLDADHLLAPEIDLGLVPEFEPTVAQRMSRINQAGI